MFDIKVKVLRKNILETLEKNKKNHISEYNEAMIEYKKQKQELSKKTADKIKKYVSSWDSVLGSDSDPLVASNFGLTKPVDNSSEYDKLIKAFGMLEGAELEMDFEDVNRISNDNFQWVQLAKSINSMYSNFK